MVNELAVIFVIDYIETYIMHPCKDCSYDEFMKWSFSNWAASEIINIIMDQPLKTIFTIMNEHVTTLLYFKSISIGTPSEKRMSIIYEVTDDIFAKLLMEEKL